jgi:hypothetical protein
MNAITPRLRESLADSRRLVDEATSRACRHVISTRGAAWSSWEVSQGLADLCGMSGGGDCTYDRPSIGVSYDVATACCSGTP